MTNAFAGGALRDPAGALVVSGMAPPLGSRLCQAMEDDARDVNILLIGDSTIGWTSTADQNKWPYLLLDALAQRYPKYTSKNSTWTGNFYVDQGTIRAGTGTHVIRLWNAGWGGVGVRFLGAQTKFAQLMGQVYPQDFDVVLITEGHNNGATAATAFLHRDDMLAFTEQLNLYAPGAEIILHAQNPRLPLGGDFQGALQAETERVAQMRGYGFVNGWRAIMDATNNAPTTDPTPGSLIIADGVHPNPAGHIVLANAFIPRFRTARGYVPAQQPSSLSFVVPSRLANSDFAAFAAPPALTSWVATNATLSKDAVNFESPGGYSVQLSPPAAAASFIEQALSAAALKELLGKQIIFGARIFVPSAAPATRGAATAGRVGIVQTAGVAAGEQQSTASADGADGWLWITTSVEVGYNATGLAFRVYANTAAATIANWISVDRVFLGVGVLPRDVR